MNDTSQAVSQEPSPQKRWAKWGAIVFVIFCSIGILPILLCGYAAIAYFMFCIINDSDALIIVLMILALLPILLSILISIRKIIFGFRNKNYRKVCWACTFPMVAVGLIITFFVMVICINEYLIKF